MHPNNEGVVFGCCAVMKNAKVKSSITMQKRPAALRVGERSEMFALAHWVSMKEEMCK